MGLKKFGLLMLTGISILMTGCVENQSRVEREASAKLVEVTNTLSNNTLNLKEETAVIRSVNFDKQNDIKIIHLVAENERQTKPYFIKISFNSKTLSSNTNSVDSTLNAIIKNNDYSVFNIVAQETTYQILELMESVNEFKGNKISQVVDGNNFYKYNINSIFYTLNENNTYDITFNTSVTNIHIDLIPTLIGEVTVLQEQYTYINYANESTFNSNISTKEDMNNQIVNALQSIIDGNFNTQTSNTHSLDYWNYEENSLISVIENTEDELE